MRGCFRRAKVHAGSKHDFSGELKHARVIEKAHICHGTEIAGSDWIAGIKTLLNLRIGIAGTRMVEEILSFRTELESQVVPDSKVLEK